MYIINLFRDLYITIQICRRTSVRSFKNALLFEDRHAPIDIIEESEQHSWFYSKLNTNQGS